MANLVEQILQQMGGETIGQMGKQLGAQPDQMQVALGNALPLLLDALARNSSNHQGAEALAGALERDHDGSILENLGGLLGNPEASEGPGILKHILGERKQNVESTLSRASGLSSGSTGKMLMMLAPIVLGYLGKKKKQENLNPGGLTDILIGNQQYQQQQQPKQMGMLGRLLDQDGDGDIKDDLLRMGGSMLLGKFLGRR